MNAGVAEAFKPREFCEIISSVQVLRPDGTVEHLDSKNLHWSYRHCKGWQPGILIAATLTCPNIKEPGIRDRVKIANQVRLQKQPLDMPSCGSVFRNPEGHKAAQLIDSCGLKGHSVGGAQVSTKHANFIVNTGEAQSEDIWKLIMYVQKTVLEKKQIQLETEVLRMS
jgi:UDP-N-acetylmuramate dehydrogenase